MKCEEMGENLSAYIDNELPDDVMKVVEQHLAGCEVCRRRYEELIKVDSLIQHLERFGADEDQVMSIVSQTKRKKAMPEIAWFPVTIRIALLTAIIVNIALFNIFRDYHFRAPSVSGYRPIRVEHVVEMEQEPAIEVSFAFPAKDTVDGFIPPEVMGVVEPDYPGALIPEHIEGTVVLNIVVDEGGGVSEIDVARTLSPKADSFAVAAAGKLRFQPARIGTVAVEAVVVLSYLFRM